MEFQLGNAYKMDDLKTAFPTRAFTYSESFWINATGGGIFIGPSAFSMQTEQSEFVGARNYNYRPTDIEERAIRSEETRGYYLKINQMQLDMVVVHSKYNDQAIFLGRVEIRGATFTDDDHMLLNFRLAEKITRPTWSLLGGFEGWIIFLKDNSRTAVVTANDAERFLSTIRDADESVAGIRYEEERFALTLESDKGCLTYHASNPETDYVLYSDLPIRKEDEAESFWFFREENPCEVSMRWVCSREIVLSCLKEILLGQVPARMEKDPFAR